MGPVTIIAMLEILLIVALVVACLVFAGMGAHIWFLFFKDFSEWRKGK